MPTSTIIVLIILVAVLAAMVFFISRAMMLQKERTRLESELAEAEQQAASLTQTLAERDKDIAVAQETLKQLDKQQEQMPTVFKAAAGEAIKLANDQFLQLAKKTFEGEQKDAAAQLEQRKQAIENLVKPIGEKLKEYDEFIKNIEASRKQAYGQLTEQVRSMTENQHELKKETANLAKALRRPEARGRWGEMQLKRVAEMAGMIEHCDYGEQVSVRSDNGELLRPDMVVHLPSGREIVIDAKTPIDAYLSAVESDSEQAREKLLKQHANQIQTQVDNLASKSYTQQFDRTPDFVVLFIPGESFLQPAMQIKPGLMEAAMSKGIVIATPSILISLLKAIAIGWREEQIAENAEKIRVVGTELHERLCTALGHMVKLGKAIKNTNEHYNSFVGSLERKVFVQAKRFEELGIQSKKKLPETIKPIESSVRDVSDLDGVEGAVDEIDELGESV